MSLPLTWSPETGDDDSGNGFDPYSIWALRYGRAFDVAARADRRSATDFEWQIVLDVDLAARIEALPATSSQAVIARRADLGPARSGQTQIRLTTDTKDLSGLAPGNMPADGPDGEDDAAEAQADVASESTRRVMRFRAPLPADAISVAAPVAPSMDAQGLAEPSAVICAVIDDSLNPLHDRFALPDGKTRVDWLWVQDAAAVSGGPVPFGRALTRAEIDATRAGPALTEAGRLASLGLNDMRRAGPRPLTRRLSHGTHIADLAAGFAPQDAPRDLRILGVALPALVSLETSGTMLAPFVIAGLSFVLDRAYDMSVSEGFPIPVVVNFSYALSGGPHNGLHVLETAIDTLVSAHLDRLQVAFPTQPERRKVDVILPTGNRAMARGHARAVAPAGGGQTSLTLPWRIEPGDRTENLLEVWVPRAATGLTVTVTPPGGTAQRLRGLRQGQALLLHPDGFPDRVLGRASLDRQRGAETDGIDRKKRVLIALAPTQMPSLSHLTPAPAGLWKIEVQAVLADSMQIEAWIQRDEPPAGYMRPGRPSWFDDSDYRAYAPSGDVQETEDVASAVRRDGTVNGIGTGQSTSLVGGWRSMAARTLGGAHNPQTVLNAVPSRYAAAAAPGQKEPARAAMSDRSRALAGVLAAGASSGSVAAQNGTSVAAPQRCRELVLAHLGRPVPAPVPLPRRDPYLGMRLLPPPVRPAPG